MKSICCFLFAMIIFGCNNSPSVPPAVSDTSAPAAPSDKPAPNVIHDTVLWIGQSARWKKTPAEIYDGSYDSVSSFFMPCGKTSLVKVMRNQIDFDQISNCDTAIGSRIKLFDLKIGDSFGTVLPHQVDLKTNSYFKSGGETISLRPAQQVRVQQAVAARDRIFIKKQMVKRPN